jgi:hypothetical protein
VGVIGGQRGEGNDGTDQHQRQPYVLGLRTLDPEEFPLFIPAIPMRNGGGTTR